MPSFTLETVTGLNVANGDEVEIHLNDEVPRVGSGRRWAEIEKIGRRWVHLRTCGDRRIRLRRDLAARAVVARLEH